MGRSRRLRRDRSRDLEAVFVIKYQAEEKPAENVIVKKLLSTAQDFTATFI